MRFAVCLILMMSGALAAQDVQPPSRLWRASLVSLAVAQAVDAHSSWGKCEANSFLGGANGRFDGRSLMTKSALTGGLVLVERWTGQRHPKLMRTLSSINFGISAGMGAVAIRNYRIGAPPSGTPCVR